MKEEIQRLLSKFGAHMGEKQREHLHRVGEDVKSLLLLPDLDLEYIPWTTAALRPAGVRALLNEVIIHHRRHIIEFGSGLSTLYIASYFEKSNSYGRVISIENDEEWASIVMDYLDEMEVSSEYCRVLEAPLRPFGQKDKPELWYDTEILREGLREEEFDMVFVDGPVSWTRENDFARYPALPFIQNRLQEEFVVFLDDAEWGDQKEIAQRWTSECGLENNLVAGMGVFRPPSSDASYDIL